MSVTLWITLIVCISVLGIATVIAHKVKTYECPRHAAPTNTVSYAKIVSKGQADSAVIVEIAEKLTDDWKRIKALRISAELQGARRKT